LLALQVTVELKNDLAITGTLHSVDQYLNIKLTNTHVQNETKYPHMVSILASSHSGCQASAAAPAHGF
jgi:U6 snRNA-associated Sm-like protein LSm2